MADDIPAPSPPRLEPISVVWHAFAAPQTLLVLMALVALVLAAAGLIPQASPDRLDEADVWVTVEPGPLSRFADLARALGLFDLFHSAGFRLLLAVAALALLVRAVDAVELAWHAGRQPGWRRLPALPWMHRAPRVALDLPAPPDRALQVSIDLLTDEGYDWAEVVDSGRSGLVAVDHPRRLWLRPLGHAALLTACAGWLIAVTWGWQGETWQPLPLEIQPVGHDTTAAVRLDAFDLRFDTRGRLVDYRSRLTWLREGAELRADVATIGRPAHLGGVALRQLGYAPVVRLSAQSAAGRALLLQIPGQPSAGREVVTVRFLSSDDQPLVFLPQHERFFTLVFESHCTAGQPAVHIYQVEQGGQPGQRIATLRDSGQIALGDVQLAVELTYVPLLRLDYRPGASLALFALGLALIALLTLWLLPTRLLWLGAAPRGSSTTQVEIKILPGATARRHQCALATRLAEAIGSDD